MKNLVKAFLFVCVSFSLSLTAQTNKTIGTQTNEQESNNVVTDVKKGFVESQGYLNNNAASFKNYVHFYADSLKGFDENTVKAQLLGSRFYGAEYIHVMNEQKREFINKKYKIGSYAPADPTQYGNKPIGGGGNVYVAPCVNEGFESTPVGTYNTGLAISGWTVGSGNNSWPNGGACVTPNYAANGSPECWIMTTPILTVPFLGTLPNSPLGGTKVLKMGDTNPGTLINQIKQTFPVTAANTLFQFAYAGSWDGSGHACCDQPFFKVDLYNCAGAPLPCSSLSLTPSGSGCQSGVGGYTVDPTTQVSWTNWVVKYIDLTPYIGSCVTIKVTSGDCNGGAHHGSCYFDSKCGGNQVGSGLGGNGGPIGGPVSFCFGSNVASIVAPLGYATYQWAGPAGVSYTPALANTPNVTVSPVSAGQVFTVTMVSASGCTFTAKDTIKVSTVYINGIATTSTCPGGASGAATVFASGSSSSISYTYTSITNPTLNLTASTASVINNLPPGSYSITVQGGGGSCGTATSSFVIGTSAPNLFQFTKPFCGTQAYLTTAGGTNFQWYNNLVPIPAPLGTASSYTVNNPLNNAIYWLSYTTPQGCKDSVKYTLQSTPPGAVAVPSVGVICPSASNGTAAIVITPAANAPTGLNSYQVFSTSGPIYSVNLTPTGSNTFIPTGLAGGTYSVVAFDGSCKYNTTFTVTPYTFSYSMSPTTATICQGNNVTASVSLVNQIVGTPCSNVGVGAPCSNPSQNILGTSNTVGQTWQFPQPYSKYYYDNHTQILYRASELTALGVMPGYITSLAFNCSAVNGIANIPNYTIKMKCTTASVVTVMDNTGFTQVYNTPNYTPVSGWNQHNFNTPYFWDGVSNVLVDLCQNAATWTFQGSTCFYTPTTYNSCAYAYSFSFVSSCGTTNLSGFSTNRPNTKFGNCPTTTANMFTYAWTPSTFLSATTLTNSIITPTTAPGTVSTINYSVVVTPTFVNCPLTQTFNITVVNPVTPTITTINDFCTNANPVTITVTPTGGTFSTGIATAPINATTGIITPSLASIGTNTFMYSVGVGTCMASNSGTFNVSQFNTANLTGTVANLCYNSSAVNLLGIVQSTANGVWSGTGVIGTYSFNPVGLATNIYTLTYNTTSAPNATLCPDNRTTLVSVLNPPQPTISQVGPYCNNAPNFQLVVTPTSGTWTATNYNNTSGTFSPALTSIGVNTVQYVIGTNTCSVQDTKTISIEAYVPAVITGSVADQCNTNSPVNLILTTSNNLGVWTGPGILGTLFDPSTSGIGTSILTYSTASSPSSLCPASATMAVNVFSLAIPSIVKAGPFCNVNAPIQLQVSPLGGVFSGVNNGATTPQGGFSPAFGVIGDNLINYTVTSGPCIAFAQTTISIEKFISADLSAYVGPYCKNNAPVNLNSIAQNPGGLWNGPGVVGSLFTPANANIGNNNVITYLTHSMPTASLCPDTSAIRIQVNELPNVSIVSNAEKGCAPIEVIFNTPSANTGSGLWNLGDGSDPVSGLTVTHLYTNPGTYTVTFNYQDEIGCSTQTVLASPIVVYEVPKANFIYNPDEVTIANPEVQFSNLTTILGNSTYQWQIGTLYQLNDVNPKVIFPQAGDYDITLTATTIHGCKDVVNKLIQVKNDYGVYVPSSFSPNYDGLNDNFIPVFSPYGLDLKTYSLEVYDRWGEQLFSTKDFTVGWNGTVKNRGDEPLKEDVYVYKIRFKDIDGKIHNKTGHVTLMK
jgi:gliding motility-associated-like protein